MTNPSYVPDPFAGRRRLTREVDVGDVAIGGNNPIRVQSMTTADTMDTLATVDQAERLVDAGCEIVRITAPSIREAENLAEIRRELDRRRIRVPLVADIHFTPNAALVAAEFVEKVRINPGNFADKKKFEVREYSAAQYTAELTRVADRFRPLVRRCVERGVALRIGTNHGSLSDRIMNRYGDTPLGMVESALEFLDVCEGEGFESVVFSMKASNAQVAIQAYRLLARRLDERGGGAPSYPFHVGVTEAGDGEDGRIKSAIGIGSLLEDGIGDTIRVSLTEDPVRELPVARALARRAEDRWRRDRFRPPAAPHLATPFVGDPYSHARRETGETALGELIVGASHPVRVEIGVDLGGAEPASLAARVATSLALVPELTCEGLLIDAPPDSDAPARLAHALRGLGVAIPLAVRVEPELVSRVPKEVARVVVRVHPAVEESDLRETATLASKRGLALEWCLVAELSEFPDLIRRALDASAGLRPIFSLESSRASHANRLLAAVLQELGAAETPILLRYRRESPTPEESVLLEAAIDLGGPLCDGIGDAVSLTGFDDPGRALDWAYRVLQGARLRTTRTEYISCPSCGRTLFDLEETTARIKACTGDLKGVKIAVMGCIVNGPGEMADADFGYVGSGPGVVNLYVGKQVVERGVSESEAPARLVDLIKRCRTSSAGRS